SASPSDPSAMPRVFQVQNAGRGTNQLCIKARDLTRAECWLLFEIASCLKMDHPDYIAGAPANPYVQCYAEPIRGNDGVVIVEFWSGRVESIHHFVEYVNGEFAKGDRLQPIGKDQ